VSEKAEDGMRIYTIAQGDQALAVVRASDADEAIEIARSMIPKDVVRTALEAREPNDAEMVGWLERRADFVTEPASA
jgi:hypothetical protein